MRTRTSRCSASTGTASGRRAGSRASCSSAPAAAATSAPGTSRSPTGPFAAVEPWGDPIALSAAVTAYIAVNGSRHGDGLFGSLPHEVANHRADLLPTPVIARALFDFMQWSESVDPGAWSLLASEHYGRIVEPNHLQRSLDLMALFHSFDLDEHARQSAAMTEDDRRRLFDEWFAEAYEPANVTVEDPWR